VDQLCKMKLVLEDGSEHEGTGLAAQTPVAGEVVFNTGMAGYVEALTDPSYAGQILVFTYPLIGNYGGPPTDPARTSFGELQSARVQVQGVVVQHLSQHFSHHRATRSFAEWLSAANIPLLTGIDTRALTRRLRERGTMSGWLLPANLAFDDARKTARGLDMQVDVFDRVAPPEPIVYSGGETRVLVVDVGAKDGIIESLLRRGATVVRAPWHTQLDVLAQGAHGILIANGPGDPADLGGLVEQVRHLLDTFAGPIFGVCLGHQILARAAGFETYKLQYGHRGINQPVQEIATGRCFVTSQNHGYAVDDSKPPADWEPWFVNLNDRTNEGLRSRTRPVFSVQFHPEGRPGPRDTEFLFDDFLRQAAGSSPRE
jgi:carbamoyl-phosphate synthase small subunit